MSELGGARARAPAPALLLAAALLAAGCGGCGAGTLGARDVVAVVLSQASPQPALEARRLRGQLQQQARALGQDAPVVHLSHEDFPHPGAWTVLPIIPRLSVLHGSNSSWVFFCESRTKIRLELLIQLLSQYDPGKDVWIGHALYDREASIIHHFAFFENPRHFKYPNFASGFAMSNSLLKRLAALLTSDAAQTDFSIDPAHELAMFIWSNEHGPRITHSPHMCLTNNDNCASYPGAFEPCGEPVNKKSIYFAVKTCKRFHKDRIPVVKNTWAKYATNIGFYSEATDESIPTIDLGVPNTERGHCGKTFAILRHAASLADRNPDIQWIVIVDDDTILSVARLQQLLSCYDPGEAVALGERYGYNVQYSEQGYNYITGGGGTVLSAPLVRRVARSRHCRCPSRSTPDDMFLGVCLAALGVPVTHSSLFHQARPSDYAPEFLMTQAPVSFHKHWMIDPIKVYDKWFADADKQFDGLVQPKHIEL